MKVTVVSVDHRGVPSHAREALVMDGAAVDAGLAQLATLHPDTEALVLATCARTELVLAADDTDPAAATWHELLASAAPGAEPCLAGVRRVLHGGAAVRHLLRVATGLDSPLLGDVDVLGQLRDARARATAAGTLGPSLTRVTDEALAVGRNARATTSIAAGAPSIAAAVLAELDEAVEDPGHLVVVGAGGAANAIVAGLPAGWRLTVANRTVGRAHDLVGSRPDARAVGLDGLRHALAEADAVVVATAGGTVVTEQLVAHARLVARGAPVIDASAPAAVAPVDGLALTDLADLHRRRDATSARREAAVPQVELLVEDAVAAWRATHDRRAVESAIAELYTNAPQLLDELSSTDDPRAAELAVKRFLHEHVTTLRSEVSGVGS